MSATAELYTRLADDLRGFLRRRVPADAVDDLLHEVFLRVHEKLVSVRDDDRVAAWVTRIARNAVVDFYRQQAHAMRPSAEEPLEVPADEPVPEDISRELLGKWLLAVLPRLPEPYRQALELVEVQGLSQADAARQLGISLSGFRSRVQRGRALLRGELDQCCHVELDHGGRLTGYSPRTACC